MKLVGRQLLREFVEKHADARSQIQSWEAEAEKAQWATPHELKGRYTKASVLKGQNVIFNICRNKYRLWVKISYKNQTILVKNVGTHREYEKWNIN